MRPGERRWLSCTIALAVTAMWSVLAVARAQTEPFPHDPQFLDKLAHGDLAAIDRSELALVDAMTVLVVFNDTACQVTYPSAELEELIVEAATFIQYVSTTVVGLRVMASVTAAVTQNPNRARVEALVAYHGCESDRVQRVLTNLIRLLGTRSSVDAWRPQGASPGDAAERPRQPANGAFGPATPGGEEPWRRDERARDAEEAYREWVVRVYAEHYGSAQAGEHARHGMSGAFGQRFTDLSREVFEADKDAHGYLVDPGRFGLDDRPWEPHDAIRAILMAEHPAAHVLQWLVDDDPSLRSIADAGHVWHRLTTIFGTEAVLAVVRVVERMPRSRVGDGPELVANPSAVGGWSQQPSTLMRELLTYGSAEGFLAALLGHHAEVTRSADAAGSLPAADAPHEQRMVAAERVRIALLEDAGSAGPEPISDEVYHRFVTELQRTSGLHVVAEFGPRQGGGFGNLLIAPDGTIYATAAEGGPSGFGFVFTIAPGSSHTQIIHTFERYQRGPSSLMLGSDGRLYGTLSVGGEHNAGLLYRLNTDGSVFAHLHDFSSARDREGGGPILIAIDTDGTLYGTSNNGPRDAAPNLFRIDPDGSGFEVTYASTPTNVRAQLDRERAIAARQVEELQSRIRQLRDEQVPVGTIEQHAAALTRAEERLASIEARLAETNEGGLGPMIAGGDGHFYGVATTVQDRRQASIIFRLRQDGGEYRILHRFVGPPLDGARAEAPPIVASDGNLYGFTTSGGITDMGVVYRLDRVGSEFEIIVSPDDRFAPGTQPVEGSDGALYAIGMLREGPSRPVLYRLGRDGGDKTIIDDFPDRAQRMAPDIQYHDGSLYGWSGRRLVRYILPAAQGRLD